MQILISLAIWFTTNTGSNLFFSIHDNESEAIVRSFRQIEPAPHAITYSNDLVVNNHGGHLQGIQSICRDGAQYLLLSGSSGSHSYFAEVQLDGENKVVKIAKLLDKPYKHAGGFQVCENLMAIGVEDNDARDKSKVMIFDMGNPEQTPGSPIAVIDRRGPRHRSTAGCVALARRSTGWIMVVGDWDTKHLDFYRTENGGIPGEKNPFSLAITIDTQTIDKKNWIDPTWLSYQNINLIYSGHDRLFLVGMTSNANDEDVADLYELDLANRNGIS